MDENKFPSTPSSASLNTENASHDYADAGIVHTGGVAQALAENRAPLPEVPPEKEVEKPSTNYLKDKIDPSIKPLRTYQSDSAEALQSKEGSVIKIALAEQQRKIQLQKEVQIEQGELPKTQWVKKIPLIALILILLGGGGFALYILKDKLFVEAPADQKTLLTSSLIPSNAERAISLQGKTAENAQALYTEINKGSIGAGGILNMYFTQGPKENPTRATPETFFEIFNLTPPGALIRSLDDEFMYGLYGGDEGAVPFLIFKNHFFEGAFSGMLAWEKTLPNKLKKLFNIQILENTESEQTTDDVLTKLPPFEDRVIKNRDVRSWKDRLGNELIVYTFSDKNTLVITKDEETLKELITRIETTQFVR